MVVVVHAMALTKHVHFDKNEMDTSDDILIDNKSEPKPKW